VSTYGGATAPLLRDAGVAGVEFGRLASANACACLAVQLNRAQFGIEPVPSSGVSRVATEVRASAGESDDEAIGVGNTNGRCQSAVTQPKDCLAGPQYLCSTLDGVVPRAPRINARHRACDSEVVEVTPEDLRSGIVFEADHHGENAARGGLGKQRAKERYGKHL